MATALPDRDRTKTASWPPTTWEVRRITGGPVVVFHVTEEGFLGEEIAEGTIILVEPPGPNGYRSTGLTTAFTQRAAQLPSLFDNCVVRVVDVLDGTEHIATYRGPLAYGSNGAVSFPIAERR